MRDVSETTFSPGIEHEALASPETTPQLATNWFWIRDASGSQSSCTIRKGTTIPIYMLG